MGVDQNYFLEVKKILPQAKTIASFHDFTKTPEVLDPIFDELFSIKTDYIKIACYANDEKDADKMIEFCSRKRSEGHLVIGICMGIKGVKTRLHSLFDYRAIPFAKKVAEGQFLL
ncbi:MAG: type I 3-dehydroquinate dehydratase [Chlamydiae bacterium]|nr:type I 3-dehydroquinate dehydratase [Chlamydiota bacterium]